MPKSVGAAPHAKIVGKVWLPEFEEHLDHMMINNRKHMRVVDGKHTYQYHKLEPCMNFMKHAASPFINCVDIGGHVGLWAMWLVNFFNHVHIFEPLKSHYDIIPYNMEKDNYTIHKVALGKESGSVSMEVNPTFTGGAHINGEGDIPMITLDSLELEDVNFIKIDVEGYELQVVQGAEQTIRRCKPLMIIEQKGNDQKNFQDIRNGAHKFLTKLGMKDLRVIAGDHIMGW